MKKRVLLIEFSPSILTIRADILERQNYEVLSVLGAEDLSNGSITYREVMLFQPTSTVQALSGCHTCRR
jgi:hypothetical protein